MKKCTRCNIEKELSEFNKASANKDGLHYCCKLCISNTKREYYLKNPEKYTWHGMIRRCTDSKRKDYKYYGGRGISVCPRWLKSYDDFLEDMGLKPTSGHSIDRIDNDRNYEPSNCKWSTRSEQAKNKRMREDNTSGFIGVGWYKTYKKWRARITLKGKQINLGYFTNIKDAVKARKDAEELNND